ncbi:MAG: hypothetical protein J3K34DRAFT_426188 [Monoraphidium minutum]|nr:MAG: hypothetical protein J3K34DRAFT_426188 [Monoraphidium minutum]
MAEGEEQLEVEEQHDDPETPGSKDKEGGLSLPLSRVKKLIRAEADCKVVGNEATFLIGRAAELVLEEMVAKAHASMSRDGRKSLLYKDIANAVESWEALDFLADVVPQKVAVSALLQQQQAQQR